MIAAGNTRRPTDLEGPTGQLCEWVASCSLEDVPEDVIERAKYILLDGVACALVGAHLPWSEKAVKAVSKMEGSGPCTIAGWEKKLGPLAAAILNSTFIQAFELDDYHSEAPLHSNAILLPALLAGAQHVKSSTDGQQIVSGALFLLSAIIGFEVGPRVGQALYGSNMLSRGWHSGPVFGPSASATACSKLFNLSAASTEDALGTACTQACGLMSAQFESDVKRMQHGFAARNGLFATLLAQEDFIGIKRVLERPYGGFLNTFAQGNDKDPQVKIDEVTKNLGSFWETTRINIKPYASMAGTHPTIDCIRSLQSKYPEDLALSNHANIMAIEIDLQDAAFEHGGWPASARPMNAIGAQMNNAYCAATQLVDGEVFVDQFSSHNLDRDSVWSLVEKTSCRKVDDFPNWKSQRVSIQMADGRVLTAQVDSPRGVDPKMTNEEVLEKAREVTKTVIDKERWTSIEQAVLNMEKLDDVTRLAELLEVQLSNALA